MKKLLVPLFALALLSPFAAASTAYALNEPCPTGADGVCPNSEVCDTSQTPHICVASDDAGKGAGNVISGGKCALDGDCSGNLACIHNVCMIDPSLEDTGTAAVGGACTSNDQCPGDQKCDTSNAQTTVNGLPQGVCVGSTGNTAAGAGTSGTQSQAVTGCTSSDGFVTLSCLPGLTGVETANGLQSFFQTLYAFCIGIACIIAVLQISRAGLMYMTAQGDSGKHTEARHLIAMSLIGLALILSPVLVFNFINPNINDFSFLTKDAASLTIQQGQSQLTNIGSSSGSGSAPAAAGPQTTANGCTGPASSGKYFKTATCDSSSDADAFAAACGTGTKSTKSIGACIGTKNAQGDCQGTQQYTATCTSIDTNAYFYTFINQSGAITLGSNGPVDQQGPVPSSVNEVKTFQNGCAADGGTYSESMTLQAGLHTGFNEITGSYFDHSCTDNITVPADKHGAMCYSVVLECAGS